MIKDLYFVYDYEGQALKIKMKSDSSVDGWKFVAEDEQGNHFCTIHITDETLQDMEFYAPGNNHDDKFNYVMGEFSKIIETELDEKKKL